MKPSSNSKIHILILAAGSSSRLGEPKQLLQYRGKTLLRKSVESAIQTNTEVHIVTGSNHENHEKELVGLEVDIIYNPTWQRGMGNSLKAGLKHVIDQSTYLNAVIIMVCDQPKIDANILNGLIEKYQEGNSLVASTYGNTNGVPALFDRIFFEELLTIQDQQGAKVLIKKHPVCSFPFADGIIDIDTKEDYEKLSNDGG